MPGRPLLNEEGLPNVFKRHARLAEACRRAVINELEIPGGLAGVEMTLKTFGVDIRVGAGLAAAEHYLLDTA